MARSKDLMKGTCGTVRWEDALGDWLASLCACGRAKSTIKLYQDNIVRFYRTKSPTWDDEREEFISWNSEPQIHTNHRLDSCGRFWRWGIQEGIRTTDPTKGVARRPENTDVIVNVRLDDIERVIQRLRERHKQRVDGWERRRDLVFAMFSVATGVRPSEGLSIARCDVRVDEQWALIRAENAKTRRGRVIFIPNDDRLMKELRRLIRIHETSEIPASAPLFCNSSGGRLSSRAWCHIIESASKECGVHVRPYDLRHAFITHSLSNGANPYDIRDQVGHANMEMMKRYSHSTSEARRATADLSPLSQLRIGGR